MRKTWNKYHPRKVYKYGVDRSKAFTVNFMGGLPLYWIIVFFFRNIGKESINLRASSIAFNLVLSLFPALIFLFTLLPYIPIDNLHQQIMFFLKSMMPVSAYEIVDTTITDILAEPRGGLLSFGLLAALWFASNGIFSLMETFNKRDNRSFWKKRAIAIGLTFALGILLITVISLFLLTEFSIELLIYYTPINHSLLAILLMIIRWALLFFLLFGACVILYRLGDRRSEKWRYTFPGAVLASILAVATSGLYAFYVESFGNYNRLYGSLGAMIITMLWLYFNAMVLIVGHEFNLALGHTKLAVQRKEFF
ncbi:MAG: YihY/virulence factor BrkB family protein, partial [Bacteroidia bacterium]